MWIDICVTCKIEFYESAVRLNFERNLNTSITPPSLNVPGTFRLENALPESTYNPALLTTKVNRDLSVFVAYLVWHLLRNVANEKKNF